MMRNYEGLAPGLYLQRGDSIKALKTRDGYSYSITWDQFVREAGSRTIGYGGSLETLAAEVAGPRMVSWLLSNWTCW